MATLSGGQVPRKPLYWDDLKAVTVAVQTDASVAEGDAELLYAWDATSSAYTQLSVNHATGGLNFYKVN